MDSIDDTIRADEDYTKSIKHLLKKTTDDAIKEHNRLIDLCWFIENGHSLEEIKNYAHNILNELEGD